MRNVLIAGAAIVAATLIGPSGCASLNAEKRTPMLGELVEVGDVRLHVVDIGPRDSDLNPVVLIHGASINLRDMHLALGDELSKDRRVILVDRPGRGYSDRPNDGHKLNVQAQLIASAVAARSVEKPIIVGQSFGGAVALAYALNHQDAMSALVLLAPVSHEWPGGVAWYNQASQVPIIGVLLRRVVIPVYAALVRDASVAQSFAPDTPPENYAERVGLSLLFRPKDFKSNASDIYHLKPQIIEQQGRYGEIALPVEIVTGLADTTVSPDLHSRTLARQIENAELTLLDNTGHALHHAQRERIIEIIDRAQARVAERTEHHASNASND